MEESSIRTVEHKDVIKGAGTWNPLEKARYYWLLMKRLSGTPHALAKGIALGTFVGVTPTIPLHTIQLILFSPLIKANPLAAIVASVVVSNPVTIPLEYYAAWKVGTMVTGFSIPWDEVRNLLATVEHTDLLDACMLIIHKSVELIEAMLLGGFILALPAGIAAYIIALKFYRARAARRDNVGRGSVSQDSADDTAVEN